MSASLYPTRKNAANFIAMEQSCANHIYNSVGKKQSLDDLLVQNPQRWNRALSNEWGRLSNGNDNGVEYTNTIEFIAHNEVPSNKKVTYASFVCNH